MRFKIITSIFLLLFIKINAQEKIIYGDCKNGFGVKFLADKSFAIGYFQNGGLNGYALAITSTRDTYAGFLKNNVCWGKGILISTRGYIYIGDYENNAQQGYGTIFVPKTLIQDGTWNNNQPLNCKKIETLNPNSKCILGDCENGPGMTFESAQSFSCIGKEMILIKKPDGYMYFGPKSGEGYLTICTKEYYYIGMGKNRLPNGEGGKYYLKTQKVEYGNWNSLKIGEQEISIYSELNKPSSVQISLYKQFKLPDNKKFGYFNYSADYKILVGILNPYKNFACYNSLSNKLSVLSANDSVFGYAVSGDGKYCAYSTSNQLKVFDVSAGKQLYTFKDTVISYKIEFTPDNKYLVYGKSSISKSITNIFKKPGILAKVIDLQKGTIITEFWLDQYFVDSKAPGYFDNKPYEFSYQGPMRFSADNQLYFNIGTNINITDYLTGKSKEFFKFNAQDMFKRYIFKFTLSPKANRFAIVTEKGVEVWNVKTTKAETMISETDNQTEIFDKNYMQKGIKVADEIYTHISDVCFSSDESSMIIRINNNLMFVKLDQKILGQTSNKSSIKNYSIIQNIPIPTGIRFARDGSKLIHESSDGNISIYDVKY